MFRRKKKKEVSLNLPVHNYSYMSSCTYEMPPQFINHFDNKMARLMELIGSAIEEWAVEYHLENLPKKFVFEQAFDAMRAIELAMNSKEC